MPCDKRPTWSKLDSRTSSSQRLPDCSPISSSCAITTASYRPVTSLHRKILFLSFTNFRLQPAIVLLVFGEGRRFSPANPEQDIRMPKPKLDKPPSEKLPDTGRANAAGATGPRIPAGKARSTQNALKRVARLRADLVPVYPPSNCHRQTSLVQ